MAYDFEVNSEGSGLRCDGRERQEAETSGCDSGDKQKHLRDNDQGKRSLHDEDWTNVKWLSLIHWCTTSFQSNIKCDIYIRKDFVRRFQGIGA